LSTAPPFILWWSNLEILFASLHRSSLFIGGLRCQAIQKEHGPYIAERTQNAVYIVRCLWDHLPILYTTEAQNCTGVKLGIKRANLALHGKARNYINRKENKYILITYLYGDVELRVGSFFV
jgi:hypothetical protein